MPGSSFTLLNLTTEKREKGTFSILLVAQVFLKYLNYETWKEDQDAAAPDPGWQSAFPLEHILRMRSSVITLKVCVCGGRERLILDIAKLRHPNWFSYPSEGDTELIRPRTLKSWREKPLSFPNHLTLWFSCRILIISENSPVILHVLLHPCG